MAAGRPSTLLGIVKAEVSSAIPAWAKAMFFRQPTAHKLHFTKSAPQVTRSGGKVVAPSGLLDADLKLASVRKANVDLYLTQDQVLRREITVPTRSLSKLDKIITLDLVQKTPFKLNEVHSATNVLRTEGEMSIVEQWIARRDKIADVKSRLAKVGLKTRRIFIEGKRTQALADFGADIAPHSRKWQATNSLLVLAALLSLGIWFFAPIWVAHQAFIAQEEQNDILAREAVDLRQAVEALRSNAVGRSEFIDQVTRRKTLSSLLRDLTVVLPDETWISDLSLQNSRLIVRGSTEGSAAELVLGLTKDKRFESPRLTGPTSQTADGRERFDLVLDLKGNGL